MSVENVPMEDLQQELARVAPGSPEEQRVLDQARQRREEKTDEFRIVRNAELEAASENGIVRGTQAQHAAQKAIEQVTGEHQIPVAHPDAPHTSH